MADSSPETYEMYRCFDGCRLLHYSCITGEVKRGKVSVSTNFVNSAHMLRTNTELLNKFEEIKSENTFNDYLEKLFHAENYGEEINDDVYLSFKKNLRFDNKKERFEKRLPFKDYSEILPDNYNLAKHRLSSLKNRSLKNNDLFSGYDNFFLSGICVTDTDNSQDSREREGTIFYSALPLPPAHEHSDIYLKLCV